MCGRFFLATPGAQVAEIFGLDPAEPILAALRPRYNIAPAQDVLVVRHAAGKDATAREAALMRWGLVPRWAKSLDDGLRTINARGESVDIKPTFRSAFRKRRCLIPADGFYEWKRLDERNKQPMAIRAGGGPFAMAGLWESWRPPDGAASGRAVGGTVGGAIGGGVGGAEIESCTIITTEAAPGIREIHERMPLILRPDQYEAWLSGEGDTPQGVDRLKALIRPFAGELKSTPIGRAVNSPRNDGPELLKPVDPDERIGSPPGLFG